VGGVSTAERKPDASTPDLESLDAAWEAGAEEPEEDGNLDEVDEGWETVPDPRGGPPVRRRVSPKERARCKSDKQRAKADAAAKKQKGKKKGRPRRDDMPASAAAESDDGREEEEASPEPRVRKGGRAATHKQRNVRTLAMIAAALAFAGLALYFMMTSR